MQSGNPGIKPYGGPKLIATGLMIDQCGTSPTGKCFEEHERHMRSCALRFFCAKITKCSVHGNKFVKPKQHVCFQLIFAVFRSCFRKLLRLALSKMCFGCRLEIFTSAIILWILALIIFGFLQFSSVDFF